MKRVYTVDITWRQCTNIRTSHTCPSVPWMHVLDCDLFGHAQLYAGRHLHKARPMLEPQFEKSRINPGTGSACIPRGIYTKFF